MHRRRFSWTQWRRVASVVVSLALGVALSPSVSAAASGCRPPEITATDLGTLGGDLTVPYDINDRGQVVGASHVSGDVYHPFVWRRGRMTDLTPSGPNGSGVVINERGQVLLQNVEEDGSGRIGLWARGDIVDLEADVPGSDSYDLNDRGQVLIARGDTWGVWDRGTYTVVATSTARLGVTGTDLSNRGHVVGSLYLRIQDGHPESSYNAFIWRRGTLTMLGQDYVDTHAIQVDDAGRVLVDGRRDVDRQGALWEDGQYTIDVGHLSDIHPSTGVTDMNRRGQVVGTSTTDDVETHAFLWQDGEMTDLGTLGGTHSAAHAMDHRGQVVGDSSTADQASHGFLWRCGHMYDLGTFGGRQSHVVDINARGQILGTSDDSSGDTRAVVWTIS